jgi:hypothetical protein
MLWLLVAGCRYHFDALAPDSDAPDVCAALAQPVPTSGTIAGSIGSGGGSQVGTCGGDDSTENMFSIDVPVAGAGLLVATDDGSTTIDTLLYVRTACTDAASEIACDEDGGTGEPAADRIEGVAAGRYYVIIDGQNGASGTYRGTAQVLLPASAPCVDAAPRDRCGPELACQAGHCAAAGCSITEVLSGASSYERIVATGAAPNLHAGTCGQGNDGGTRAPEVIYELTLPAAVTNVHVSTANAQTDYDTLIYVRASCAGSEIACDDDSGTTTVMISSTLDTGPLAAGSYLVFVDGFATSSGTADVTIDITP